VHDGEVIWSEPGDRPPRRAYPAVLCRPIRAAGSRLGDTRSAFRRGPRRNPLRLAATGASFWAPVRASVAGASDAEVLASLWDLVWAARSRTTRWRRCAPSGRRRDDGAACPAAPGGRHGPGAWRASARPPVPGGGAYWSLRSCCPVPSPTEACPRPGPATARAHGVVTREAVLAEGVVSGYASGTGC
jgi:hypothetical protein